MAVTSPAVHGDAARVEAGAAADGVADGPMIAGGDMVPTAAGTALPAAGLAVAWPQPVSATVSTAAAVATPLLTTVMAPV